MSVHICSENCQEHNPRKFFNYHVHSIFSARDCINTIDDLYRLGKEYGQEVGITDHGNIGAWVESYQTAKKHGMKWIPGCEFYIHPKRDRIFEIKRTLARLAEESKQTSDKEAKDRIAEIVRDLNIEFNDLKRLHHVVAIAKNTAGMYELMEIHNNAYKHYFYGKPITSYTDFFKTKVNKDGSRNIILTTACLASTSSQYILSENEERAEAHILDIFEYYKNDLYLELQANGMKEQKKVNHSLLRIAQKHGLPTTIANDAHYPLPEHGKTHQYLLLMQGGNVIEDIGQTVWNITHENRKGEIKRSKVDKEGGTFKDIEFERIKVGDYVRAKKNKVSKGQKIVIPAEIITDQVTEDPKTPWDFKILDISETNKAWIIEADNLVYGNKNALAEMATLHEEITSEILDTCFENNMGINEKIEVIELDLSNKLPRMEGEDQIMYEKCLKSLEAMGKDMDDAYLKRFHYEYKVITKGGFSNYFLILADIHEYCVRERIPKGIARGSSASSLIAFLLGITLVDPLLQSSASLFDFRRFLNPARVGAEIATFYTENGRKYQLFLDDSVIVRRDNKDVVIEVKDMVEGDIFVREGGF